MAPLQCCATPVPPCCWALVWRGANSGILQLHPVTLPLAISAMAWLIPPQTKKSDHNGVTHCGTKDRSCQRSLGSPGCTALFAPGHALGWVFSPSLSPLPRFGNSREQVWHTLWDLQENKGELQVRVSLASLGSLWHSLGTPKSSTWAPGHRKEGEMLLGEISAVPCNIFISVLTSQRFETEQGWSRMQREAARAQERQEGLLPQEEQPLRRPQSVPALGRSREVAGEAKAALIVTPATPVTASELWGHGETALHGHNPVLKDSKESGFPPAKHRLDFYPSINTAMETGR